MRYGLISIGGGVNLGNRLIEFALRQMLGLPLPAAIVPMFHPISDGDAVRLNDCDFVMLPGSTILADGPGQSEALHSLHKIKVPILCVAASGWGPGIPYHGREVLDRITPPIGARDPHTLAYLEGLGIPAILVGCPTAYLPHRIAEKEGIVLGYGRSCVPWQQANFEKIRGDHPQLTIRVAVQEPAFDGVLADQLGLDSFTYHDPGKVYDFFSRAGLVITGRLHGILPAMSQRCDVVFFGDKGDSRFSILHHLGIKMTQYGEYPISYFNRHSRHIFFTAYRAEHYLPRLSELRNNFFTWKDKTLGTYLHP